MITPEPNTSTTAGTVIDLCERREAPPTFDELHDRWSDVSRSQLGLSRSQWTHPATTAVVRALAEGDDLTHALRALGEARAGAGLSLDETLSDLAVLAGLLPEQIAGVSAFDALRAAAVMGTAWSEAFYGDIVAPGCTDPITGLVTGTYLEARMAQLFQQRSRQGRRPDRDHVLVVLQLRCQNDSPFLVIARRIQAAGQLRDAFPDSDTIAILQPTHAMVALVDDDELLSERLATLRATRDGDTVWIEHLGTSTEEAQALVRELSSIPRVPGIAQSAGVGHP